MLINGKNYLLLERRGCEFTKNDKINNISDVGNHRLDTLDYDIQGEDGKKYFIEFVHGCNKNAGKLYISACYCTEVGCFSNLKLEKRINDKEYSYTEKNILKAVNSISAEKYDGIKYVVFFEFDGSDNFTPHGVIYQHLKDYRNCKSRTDEYGEQYIEEHTGEYKYLCYRLHGKKSKMILERV